MDRALRIALDEGLQAEAGRAYSNYYATHCSQRQFAAAEQLFADGIAYCDDHDITTYGTFLRSERTGMLEKTGRWDEALALCQDILDRAAPAPVTRLCPATRAGTLMARRGEATAWEYLDQAMADADRTGEPQSIVPVRLARAEACWLEGRAANAVTEAERADEAADTDDAWTYGAVAAWLRRTGSSRRPRGELAEPYRQQLSGHWEKAAQLWTDLNCPYEAALVRLDAAEEGALREALSTFTELGASAVARLTRQRLRALGARSIPAGPGPRPEAIHWGSPGASARSSGRSAPGRPTRRSRRSCSSRPRPSTTTSPPCSPSSARRTATPPRPRPPSSACSRERRGCHGPRRSDRRIIRQRERCIQLHGRCRSDLCDETGEIAVTVRRA